MPRCVCAFVISDQAPWHFNQFPDILLSGDFRPNPDRCHRLHRPRDGRGVAAAVNGFDVRARLYPQLIIVPD
jgi:hypothetical protein